MLALRQLSRKTPTVSRAITSAISYANPEGAPSVKDSIVHLTFVDPSGARRQVPAFIGDTISDTAETHQIDLGPTSTGALFERKNSEEWLEPLYGEGCTSGYDHVLLNGNGVETAPPMNRVEERMLKAYWDTELYPESRLASMIPVTKEMDGMTVFVPDRIVDDTP
mmetsp:Transcript_24862/g.36778  ORF Transcript_24862/g.36778 Transcript_24862/m.36778 type:complete len:166 (-) Transcript_24862:1393-1890(-)